MSRGGAWLPPFVSAVKRSDIQVAIAVGAERIRSTQRKSKDPVPRDWVVRQVFGGLAHFGGKCRITSGEGPGAVTQNVRLLRMECTTFIKGERLLKGELTESVTASLAPAPASRYISRAMSF